MLGRLRRKFVLIIMVLLGLVLGTALAVQTASGSTGRRRTGCCAGCWSGAGRC